MRLKTKILSIFIISLILIECSKDNINNDDKSNKYIVHLTNEYKILEIDYFKLDTFDFHRSYNYKSKLIDIVDVDNKNNVIKRSIYFINSSNLADSCIDSVFSNSQLYYTTLSKFKYDNSNYKVSTESIYKSYSENLIISSSSITFVNIIVSGNKTITNIEQGSCSDFYGYYDSINKLDLSFLGNFNGEKSKNLLKSFHTNCNYGQHQVTPKSEYEYKLNNEGLVIEMIEKYTPSYDYFGTKANEERKITKYEYIYQ